MLLLLLLHRLLSCRRLRGVRVDLRATGDRNVQQAVLEPPSANARVRAPVLGGLNLHGLIGMAYDYLLLSFPVSDPAAVLRLKTVCSLFLSGVFVVERLCVARRRFFRSSEISFTMGLGDVVMGSRCRPLVGWPALPQRRNEVLGM